MLTRDDIERAKQVNLPEFLQNHGFSLKRVSHNEYQWEEHDSLKIYDNPSGERGKWYRFSTEEGGDNIKFLQQYMGLSFQNAVALLLENAPNLSTQQAHSLGEPRVKMRQFSLRESDEISRVQNYLADVRCLNLDSVNRLIKDGKIAQEEDTGNVIFKIFDENQKLIGAEKVGTGAEKFKSIERGSLSGYGFSIETGSNPERAYFFESAIDLLSFAELNEMELTLNPSLLVSMMGVKGKIVEDTVKRYGIAPENIYICSDSDLAGEKFALQMQYRFYYKPR